MRRLSMLSPTRVSACALDTPLRPKPLAHAVRGALLVLCLGWLQLALPENALAQSVDQVSARQVEFDIGEGSLSTAIGQFGAQAGVPITTSTELVQGKRTQGVQGRYSVEAGLELLLSGSSLRAVQKEGRGYILEPILTSAGVSTLQTVRVTGARIRDGESEGSGSYAAYATTIGKTAQTLREIPQSVSVITKARLEDQNIQGLVEAAEQTVGLSVRDSGHFDNQIYSRGFPIESIQVDGGAPLATNYYLWDVGYNLAEYDRVEVLRGAAGLINGTGNPGGSINLVRKMPTSTPQLRLTASVGRWDQYRTEVDVSGPIAFDGKVRGRAVIAYESNKSFQDYVGSKKPFFYGVLETDLSESTVLAAGYRYEKIDVRGGARYLPRYADGSDLGLPRHTNLSEPWGSSKGSRQELFANVTQRLAERWTMRANVTYSYNEADTLGVFGMGAIAPGTGEGALRIGSYNEAWNRQLLADINLSGAFDLFGRTHEVLAGIDFQSVKSQWQSPGGLAGGGAIADVFNPGATPWPEPSVASKMMADYDPNQQKQYGAYGTLRLAVADGLKVIVGARANKYRYDQIYRERWDAQGNVTETWQVAGATQYSEPTKVVPFAGVLYDLSPEWTAYASYAQIFLPQADKKSGPAPGSGLDPMRGTNMEVGLKGELLDGELNTALALFRIVQDKRAVSDPRYPAESILFAGSCCYLASGKVISQGLDVEISGEVARGLNVYAGYTYNSTRDKQKNAPFSSITPRHLLKFWGTYQLPGRASDWKIGAGATIQSKQYVSGTAATYNPASGRFNGPSVPFDYTQSGYAVWNAMVEYRYNPNWTLTLNVNNLLDKTYYRTVGSSALGNYYGEPRSWALTLRGQF